LIDWSTEGGGRSIDRLTDSRTCLSYQDSNSVSDLETNLIEVP